MDEGLRINTISTNINHPFMLHLMPNYNQLKDYFVNDTVLLIQNVSWRDDIKLLHHLIEVFKLYIENMYFPKEIFKKYQK